MIEIIPGDCRETLRGLPDESVQCVVTSPPYWGLRDYGVTGQIGMEKTPRDYVLELLKVFSEVKRVLKRDGTLWLNLGDSYAASGNGGHSAKQQSNRCAYTIAGNSRIASPGLKPKDLVGIPWMAAFALRDELGLYLRCDIVWSKPNPMPESVTDRPTRAHEYIFLFSKSPQYYYDHEAIKEAPSPDLIKQIEEGYNGSAVKDYLKASVQDASATKSRIIDGYRKRIDKQRGHGRRHCGFNDKWDALTPAEQALCGRNKRSVWTVAPANFPGAHFATYPPELIQPCIRAGSQVGDTILDPFGGSGTTGQVAIEEGRKAIVCELNPNYIPLIKKRTDVTPGLPI